MDDRELVSRIRQLLKEQAVPVIAIDGPCGGGKTTLAARLQGEFQNSTVIPADDFFLQPDKRTPERLAEPEGNMDRERLEQEVLIRLKEGQPFTYQRYDCQENRLVPVSVSPTGLVIVEGSYCLHPELTRHYHLKIFLDVDAVTQLSRLAKRVPAERMARFVAEWIPLERRYFETFRIKENSDLTLSL